MRWLKDQRVKNLLIKRTVTDDGTRQVLGNEGLGKSVTSFFFFTKCCGSR